METGQTIEEIGGSISETVSETVSEVSSSGSNLFNSIASAIGIDLSALSLTKVIVSVAMLVMFIVLAKVLSAIIGKALKKSRMAVSMQKFVTRIIRFVMYFMALMIFADSIGIPITSIVAVFGLFGLAISLSIQNLLGNIMSGVSLVMLRPFEVGDYIETDIPGTVKSIGLFYTEITTIDNKRVFIPNEKIVESRLTNYTSETRRRIDVRLNAAYGCDVKTVKRALAEAVESVPELLNEPEPIIGVAEYGESAIYYDVLVWASTESFIKAKYALLEAVPEFYKKYGIEMAYNRLEVELIGEKSAQLRQ